MQANNEFWEPLTTRPMQMPMICAFDKCSKRYDKEFVRRLFKTIFCRLTEHGEYFPKNNNSALDMIHRHVVTDGLGEIVLCNKHLLLRHSTYELNTKNGSVAAKPQRQVADLKRRYKYQTSAWEREVLKVLFPRNDQRVPLETRTWLASLLKSNDNDAKRTRTSLETA
ncbi:uncharacterized protein LOC112595702 [Melanaphis sacchari]|uniref:uncharacterized protein LOC112595702 n=1 Tax=Melanaphis sacchari TaxID=742174 RepID=UPI000DC12F61|nr:uncharacterized protein LOC112595702 [Melanaphis sacchari]